MEQIIQNGWSRDFLGIMINEIEKIRAKVG
jgi:hypothetical protein